MKFLVIYNFAHYTIYPLADMPGWDETGAELGGLATGPPGEDLVPPGP